MSTLKKYAACWVGLLALLFYFATLCPGIAGGDSGMFIGTAYQLGVSHPPGYPLYTLLAHFATLLPWGSVAMRVNALSSVFDATAVAIVFAILQRLTQSAPAAFTGALMMAFSPLFWRYAVIAEVFALNNLFAALLLYCTLRFWQQPSKQWAYVGALCLGLGLSNHHTLVLIGVPLTFAVLWRGKTFLLRPKTLLSLFALFAAGLLPYAYLPWAAARHALISWGQADTLQGFMWHVLRKDFGTFRLGATNANSHFWASTANYLSAVASESLFAGAVVIGVGLWQGLRGKNSYVRISALAFVCYLGIFHALANIPLDHPISREVQARFWQQANLFIFIWLGLGVHFLWRKNPPALRWGIAIVAVATQCAVNYRGSDQSWNTAFLRFGRAVLNSLPQNTMLISQGDVYLNTLRYVQQVENLRPDIAIVDKELIKMRWYNNYHEHHLSHINIDTNNPSLLSLVEANRARFPIFTVALPDLAQSLPGYEPRPFGLLYQIVPKGTPFDLQQYLSDSQRAIRDMMGPDVERAGLQPDHFWDKALWEGYWDAQMTETVYLFNIAQARGGDRTIYTAILNILQTIKRDNPRPADAIAKNIGVVTSLLAKLPNAPPAQQ